MVLALIKLNNIRPRRITRVEWLLPKIYPTIEERINDIKTAEESKKKSRVENLEVDTEETLIPIFDSC